MNKKLKSMIPVFIVLLLITTVIAGIGFNSVSKTRELPKIQRDVLLSKTSDVAINPTVDIKCSDDYCLYDAVQSGIINSRDNRLQRYYMNCLELDENNKCINELRVDYTDTEIQDMIADRVLDKLSKYADAEIQRGNYEPWGNGTVTITEK